VDHCHKLLMVIAAAASPDGRQRSEGPQLATAQLAPKPFRTANGRRLPPQVTARVIEAMASPTRDSRKYRWRQR
jgi:hypothetical protein